MLLANGALPKPGSTPVRVSAPPAATLAAAASTPYARSARPPSVAIGVRIGGGIASRNSSQAPSRTRATGQYDAIQLIEASGPSDEAPTSTSPRPTRITAGNSGQISVGRSPM